MRINLVFGPLKSACFIICPPWTSSLAPPVLPLLRRSRPPSPSPPRPPPRARLAQLQGPVSPPSLSLFLSGRSAAVPVRALLSMCSLHALHVHHARRRSHPLRLLSCCVTVAASCHRCPCRRLLLLLVAVPSSSPRSPRRWTLSPLARPRAHRWLCPSP